MRTLTLAGCCAAAFVVGSAQSKDADETIDPAPLDEILVTGEYPGPGLWKVSKEADDGQHVLWIFGTLDAIPAAIKWRSRQVEKIVNESQEIIWPEGINLTPEKHVGVFTMLSLIPAALRARKNPDGKKLQEVLPADVYARWLVQKAKYIGNDSGIENFKNFAKTPLRDVDCLDTTMNQIDVFSDEKTLSARATAWAKGNLAALREYPAIPDPDEPCTAALMGSQVIQDLHLDGFDDLAASGTQKWIEAAEAGLTNNRSTLALLPIDEVLKPDGRLATLRAKGYRVEDPTQ